MRGENKFCQGWNPLLVVSAEMLVSQSAWYTNDEPLTLGDARIGKNQIYTLQRFKRGSPVLLQNAYMPTRLRSVFVVSKSDAFLGAFHIADAAAGSGVIDDPVVRKRCIRTKDNRVMPTAMDAPTIRRCALDGMSTSLVGQGAPCSKAAPGSCRGLLPINR